MLSSEHLFNIQLIHLDDHVPGGHQDSDVITENAIRVSFLFYFHY